MQRKFTILVATMAAVLIAVSASTAASGQETPPRKVALEEEAAHANWTSSGDKVEVCDDQDDGWGAKVDIAIREPGTTAWIYKFTIDDPKSTDNCSIGSKNVTEDWEVRIHLFLYQGSETGVEAYIYSTT
jgi:hypothetical protein